MKKTLLALAVAAASVSTAASAATVYQDDSTTLNMGGRVEVRANFSDANKTANDDNQYKDASRVRFNLGGDQKINSDVSIIGFTEWEITETDEDETNINTRYLYAGVQSQQYGALTYGHQENALTYLTNFTDMAEVYSGYVNEYNIASADRASNVLRYAFNTDKLTIQASVQGDSDSDGSYITQNGDGYGIMGAYKLTDALELALGYSSVDVNEDGTDAAGTGDNTSYNVGLRYANDNGLYLAAMYAGGTVSPTEGSEHDYNSADAYAGYTFGDNNVNMTYSYYEADDNKQLDINFVAFEYARHFGNASVYGAYRLNLLDGDDYKGITTENGTDDEIQLGLRYAF